MLTLEHLARLAAEHEPELRARVAEFDIGGHAFAFNSKTEFERNKERYAFLKWGQKAFRNFRVVPPETGICHQAQYGVTAVECIFRM